MHTYFQSFNQIPGWLFFVIGGLFGACVASFLGVVGERVPRGETLGGRSHCVCGKPLGAGANLPVIGWLLSGGKARCCGSQIPVRYVLTESAMALAWGVAAWVSPTWWVAAALMAVIAAVTLWTLWVQPDAK